MVPALLDATWPEDDEDDEDEVLFWADEAVAEDELALAVDAPWLLLDDVMAEELEAPPLEEEAEDAPVGPAVVHAPQASHAHARAAARFIP